MRAKGIMGHFSKLKDPRREGYAKKHKLMDVITIAVCEIICRCNNWEEVEDFGHAREK